MRKIMGFLLVLAAVFMAYVGIAAIAGAPDVENAASQAVWLGDDRYDPENEGKLVVMILSPEKMEPARDPDLDITFDSFVASRRVEEFKHVAENSLRWRALGEGVTVEGLGHADFIGRSSDPDALQLDEAYAPLFSATEEVIAFNYDSKKAEKLGFHEYFALSRTYLTNATQSAFDDPETQTDPVYADHDDLGRIRLWYTQGSQEQQPVAVIGIQQGRTLVPDTSLDMAPVSDNIESLEEMIGSDKDTVIAGSVGFLVCAAGLLLWGLVTMGVIKVKKSARSARDMDDPMMDDDDL